MPFVRGCFALTLASRSWGTRSRSPNETASHEIALARPTPAAASPAVALGPYGRLRRTKHSHQAFRSRYKRNALALALGLLLVSLIGSEAKAQQTPADVERIAKLGSNPDFRVRTQAALALGASRQKAAVAPLCRSLSDSNTTV